MTRAEEDQNDSNYAMLCIEQIEILSSINKAIAANPMTHKQFKIIRENIGVIMQLWREYQNVV